MSLSIREARERLARAGIGLGKAQQRRAGSQVETVFPVVTPVGTTLEFRAQDVIGMVRQLQQAKQGS